MLVIDVDCQLGYQRVSYIPSGLELFQIPKFPGDSLIHQQRFVLPQRSLANFGILCFRDGIFKKGFFEFIKCYYNAKELGE